MQTLLDPFELAPSTPPTLLGPLPAAAPSGERLRAAPARAPSIDVEGDDPPAPRLRALPPVPDSSGRLRTWCSED
jgi:hypothetical protein